MELYTQSGHVITVNIGDQISFNYLLIRSKQDGSRTYHSVQERIEHEFYGDLKRAIVTEINSVWGRERIYISPSLKDKYPGEYKVNYILKANMKNIIVKKSRLDIDNINRYRHILNLRRSTWRKSLETIYINLEVSRVSKEYEKDIYDAKSQELSQLSDFELCARTEMLSELPLLTRKNHFSELLNDWKSR